MRSSPAVQEETAGLEGGEDGEVGQLSERTHSTSRGPRTCGHRWKKRAPGREVLEEVPQRGQV